MQHGKGKSNLFSQHAGEEHDEELWLISYADMVTLLFGFFVILFSFSTLEEKKFDQMSEKVAEAFKSEDKKKVSESDVGVSGEERQLRAMQMLISMVNLGENMDDAVGKIEKAFAESKNDAAAKNVLMEKIAVDHRDLVKSAKSDDSFHTVELVLPDTSLFASGSFQLSPQGGIKLKSLAADLQNVSDLMAIEISGHTDSRPPAGKSAFQNNFSLSSLRAGAVAEVLIRAGVEQKRLSVRGMGSLQPILPERDLDGHYLPANMSKNRRVTILLKLRDSHDPRAH